MAEQEFLNSSSREQAEYLTSCLWKLAPAGREKLLEMCRSAGFDNEFCRSLRDVITRMNNSGK